MDRVPRTVLKLEESFGARPGQLGSHLPGRSGARTWSITYGGDESRPITRLIRGMAFSVSLAWRGCVRVTHRHLIRSLGAQTSRVAHSLPLPL